jgi:hypothetical protein
MAKFRLLRAHYMPGDKWLPGDMENEHLGDEKGTVVGDGTPHLVRWPTLEMAPLDEEAAALLDRERERLEMDAGTMTPVEQLPMNSYETMYTPGSNMRRGAVRPDGSTIAKGKG